MPRRSPALKAAVDARDEARKSGDDIVIVARTDARQTHGLEEALERARAFAALGADVIFVEALESKDELQRVGAAIDRPLLANLLEGGKTPILSHAELEALGFKLAAYPLTLLNVSIVAMRGALEAIGRGEPVPALMPFSELRKLVGFDDYDRDAARYATEN